MEFIIYLLIFIMGTFFGSFFTLAVYRIPLGLDITHEHSFCPSCNTKLKTKDLIPVLSYIFLGGKCRYCGEKVRIRYLALEVLSGLVFLLFSLSFNINFFVLDVNTIIFFCFYILYIACLFIIAGIDKERKTIQKSVLLFGILLATLFMIYACIVKKIVIYTYIICLVAIVTLLLIDTLFLKKNLTSNYGVSVLVLSVIMIIFSGVEVFYYSVALSFLLISISFCAEKIKNKEKNKSVINTKENKSDVPIGFFLTVSNIALLIISNFLIK